MMRAAVLVLIAAAPVPATPSANAEASFHAQRDTWNHGRLEEALAYYLDDPAMTWVNRSGIEFGLKEFADAMRADFSNHPDQMGTFSGEVLHKRDLSDNAALLVVRWSISRDGKRLMGGISTQLWERRNDHWRVVFEHAS